MSRWQRVRATAREFGVWALLLIIVRHLVNAVVGFDVLIVVRQERERSRCPDTPDLESLSCRVVRASEYEQVLRRLDPDLVRLHGLRTFAADARPEDLLLLTYVDAELAGFTFAHDSGQVDLAPGVRLRVPSGYLYNFSAFTVPEYRGRRHQGWRHHALLHSPECDTSRGLIGYVLCNNLGSRRGLRKSGYEPVGNIYHLHWGRLSIAWRSASLRRAGIQLVARTSGRYGSASHLEPASDG